MCVLYVSVSVCGCVPTCLYGSVESVKEEKSGKDMNSVSGFFFVFFKQIFFIFLSRLPRI